MGILLLVQIILIALNAVFASAEIAVLSVNEARLEQMARQGDKKAVRLYRLTREPARFLSTIQIAITLSGFLGSAFAADGFSDPLVDWVVSLGVSLPRQTLDTIAVVLITLILSYFTLIFGELVPKRIAMKKSEQLALAISGLIAAISAVFRPVVWLLSLSTNAVLRLCGIDPHEEEEQVSEEEIRMMVKAGGDRGTIDREEQAFIQNVFEFDDITAEEIATHRTDVTILWLEDDDETWAKTIHDSRHTLYPVCDGSPDNVTGVLNAKDYFRLSDRSRQSVLAGAVSPAYFVPETIKADVLFRNMRKNRQSMAVVLDEYGGVVGIITLNDLLEELVGDLSDTPEDGTEERIEQEDEATWRITGNIALDEIEKTTGLDLRSGDYETFTGMAFDALGMVLGDEDKDVKLDLPGLSVTIVRVKDHQIAEAVLHIREGE
ncbi:MAG TPA: HlyC/CorC family transporter [Candidatus Ventricola intestinavium]|nr:HlyC/CorC family transporter [Candidatus Ventricola intestinavium]